MQYPLVSAIVLCYNQARFVIECLEGIKAQQYPNLELIVNDDASQDGSAAVIQAWLARSGSRHRFLRNEANQGLCRSLNNALSHARGKYISAVAADDVWLPGKLRTQVERMERLPHKFGVIYSDALQMDEWGKVLPRRFIGTYRKFEWMPEGNIYKILWGGNFIPAMTTLIRRECYDKVGLFDETLYYEDWDMWLRIARCFEFAYADEISAKYRIVSTSMMQSQGNRIIDAGCQVCLKHLRAGNLKPDTKTAAALLFYNYAIASYEHKTLRHKHNLLQALGFRPTPGLALRCIYALCGVGSEKFACLRRLLQVQSSNGELLRQDE
ncbi:MAG: glycosyltransferase [Verrucomicrobiota bacterium]|jgi:glycosyltransferase involved in cell wall biosynthesis